MMAVRGLRTQLAHRGRRSRTATDLVRAPRGTGTPPVSDCAIVQRFRYKSQVDDAVVGRTWDGETEGVLDVVIAKPWLMRRSPFDGEPPYNAPPYAGTKFFSHDFGPTPNPKSRKLVSGFSAERQNITPAYIVDDEIWAVRLFTASPVLANGVTVDDVENLVFYTTPWIDLNFDKRTFAMDVTA